jgi:hypothetical protein
MDALSGIASAIAVIQIAEEVCTLLHDYASAVKDARKDIKRLRAEVLALHSILEKVEDLKNQKFLDLLAEPGGPIQQCHEDLKDLSAKLNPGHGPTTMKRVGWRAMKWPFESKDVDKKIEVLDRHKLTFTLAICAGNTCVLIPLNFALLSDVGLR